MVLVEAADRDLEADRAAPETATVAVAETMHAIGQLYGFFLHRLDATQGERDMQLALARLHRTLTEEQLTELLADCAILLHAEVAELLRKEARATDVAEQRRMLEAEADLLTDWHDGDRHEAWRRYEATVGALWQLEAIPRLSALIAEFEEIADADPAGAIPIGEEIVTRAGHIRWYEPEAGAAWQTAVCNLRLRDRRHPERIERAIALLEHAEELYRQHPDIGDEQDRWQMQANLAAALGERTRSDFAANQRRAIAIHHRLLEQVTLDNDPDLWAKTHTHLATNMLQLAVATGDEDGDRLANLDDVLGHLHEALRWRSRDRNPLDWAYTQMHLGRAHAEGGGSLEAAVEHFSHAVDGFTAAGNAAMAARARADRASVQLAPGFNNGLDAQARRQIAAEAEADVRASLEVLDRGPGTVADGNAWWQLARALMLGDATRDEVKVALGRALKFWTPTTAPEHTVTAALALGRLHDGDGDAAQAADAWALAAEAAAVAMQLPSTREARLVQARRHPAVFAEAAYRLATTGRAAAAVEILELGRARELAAWLDQDLIDLAALRHADPDLHDRFVELRGDVAAMQSERPEDADVRVAAAAQRLDELLEGIRDLAGLEGFLRRPQLDVLLDQAPGRQAIAYPVICRAGCAWLIVRPDRSGDSTVDVVQLDIAAAEIGELLLRVDRDTGDADGYLPSHRDTDRLDEQIAAVADVLGPGLMSPLSDHLVGEDLDEVCLVPVGWLGLLPLHAVAWTDDDQSARTLIDGFVVAYAPSAYARVACQRRAQDRDGRPRTLLAVGNPLPNDDPLGGAEAEATVIADLLPAEHRTVLLTTQATKDAVVAALPAASHVHLACHGSAALTTDAMRSALWFAAHQGLSAGELVDLDLSARLVVASACQSGVIAELRAVDEALAMSNVIIAAGAAGVVASLWEVSDYATALLMTRMYELLRDGAPPARALREASIWLRDMTVDDERAFLTAHARLADAVDDEARQRLRTSPPHEQGLSAPTLWAAFTFSGA